MSTPERAPDILYEHDDGRYAVNPDTAGDPGWHRLGPVEVFSRAAQAAAVPAVDPQWLADQVKNGIADFIGDNWPDRRITLADIEDGIRTIEVNAAKIISLRAAAAGDAKPATQGDGS